MGRPDDDAQGKKFLELLRENGGSLGNYNLMGQLRWSENEYWRIRDKLTQEGSVLRGKGKGGSVILAVKPKRAKKEKTAADTSNKTEIEIVESIVESKEAELYAPCLKTLQDKWTQERSLHNVHIEITASQGGKKTGGVWTRPDISAISMRTFTHWPGRTFDIWTFEVKPSWQFSVTGVFEAAAHARTSTHSFALFEKPDVVDSSDESRLVTEAQRMGVGLVFFEKPDVFDTWDFMVDPLRREPDPALLDQFVVTQLSQTARNKLLQWSK